MYVGFVFHSLLAMTASSILPLVQVLQEVYFPWTSSPKVAFTGSRKLYLVQKMSVSKPMQMYFDVLPSYSLACVMGTTSV